MVCYFPFFYSCESEECASLARPKVQIFSALANHLSSSKRLSYLPPFPPPGPPINKLFPTNRKHGIALLTRRHHNPQLIPRRLNIIIALISQTNNHAADQIPYAKRVRDSNFIFFRGAHVLAADEALECGAAHRVVDDEDFGAGEARA